MLRNTTKANFPVCDDNYRMEKKNIYNKRIEKEIKNLKESKFSNNDNIYITITEKDENENEYDDVNSSDYIQQNKYLQLVEAFDDNYFIDKTFFITNFIENIKVLKNSNIELYNKNNKTELNGNRNNYFNCEEIYKFNTYKNSICPFYGLYESLNLELIFNSYSLFLDEICYFLKIFDIFKSEFIKEHDRFNDSNRTDNKNGKDNYDKYNISGKEEKVKLNFYANIFFEIIYKDITTHLQQIQRELINKIVETDEYIMENFYNNFYNFFMKYYTIKESIVYDFCIFNDYPFSEVYVHLNNIPFCFLKKKNVIKLTGDKYNKRNILSTLINSKDWIPKITILNLFEKSQDFAHKLFFYYQYKIFIFYYYLNKHKIFCKFFENNYVIDIETSHLVYSYIKKVNKKLITHEKKPKKNYSNMLYKINNCECINENVFFYKLFYNYKKLKLEKDNIIIDVSNCETHGVKVKKKKRKNIYQYYIYLFFILFIFLIPQFIKNIYILFQTHEIDNYFNDAKIGYINFDYQEEKNNFNNYPIFYIYINTLKKISHYNIKDGQKIIENENFEITNDLQGNNIKTEQTETNDNDNIKIKKLKNNIWKEKKIDINSMSLKYTVFLMLIIISEFCIFSLGVIYNLHLLRTKFEHINFVTNVCSSVLILYNPVLLCSKINYINSISIGLLFWSINFIILKKIFLAILIYFISIYINIQNIIFFFPFMFIYVYINGRYIIKKGNQIKSQIINIYKALKYAIIYICLFIILTYFFLYLLSEEKVGGLAHLNKCFNYFNNTYFEKIENVFISLTKLSGLSITSEFGKNSTIYKNNTRHCDNNWNEYFMYIMKSIPIILTLFFNYIFSISTLIKFYISLIISCITFFLINMNYKDKYYLLKFMLTLLLLYINVLNNTSILLNILFTSYIILINENLDGYIFLLTITYFIFHTYLMYPSNNFNRNIYYQTRIGTELIKQVFSYIQINLTYFYQTCIKRFLLSLFIFIPGTSSSIISPEIERNVNNMNKKIEIQQKIVICLYSHLSWNYLSIPLSFFFFFLFFLIGLLKLCYPKICIKSAESVLKFCTHISLLIILMLLYKKRDTFKKYDFLSIPDSPDKRAFPVNISKKL
ncbi:conserved Plasmodium protein, unknown function [Plasmodium berghei]|uniref:Uncharacterized protein n=2 Tax=Plasmodium berghei TaxID=5821 RepID=A0A509AN35_PLABA|nr:conserved Plasmodium protein, unknown function [Plasmodium berghei ANKA]CXI54452.1 conserved Plasmodium protein, unknown function [Plasmodium berghei]SCL94979.1 conserved Plasmodium protein, unknown function [Plasmodium berghei]SCM16147.1 conserved Plasmodium protein, unknown function [Plasmodium berghei]SCM17943.1 conserved Plasmodium protein, unknown function [Plasmodium berghei]SCN26310.1 conserved Plasmodium protein, unknown function [Plasmodium berghei]|eukprot:XP_034422071.1 conserved Plasmodium protein, unknown function [Plasmodium berghei ANKA]